MRTVRLLWALPLLVLLLVAACGPGSTPTVSPAPAATATPPPAAAGPSADVQGFAFQPPTVTVAAGATITWTNRDEVNHTVSSTSAPDGQGFNSGTFGQTQAFSVTFTVPGTYQYQCNIHPFMKGTVVVTE